MKASVLDLRRRMPTVLKALERNESVTITHHGKEVGILSPKRRVSKKMPMTEHPSFGMWKDRSDMKDPVAYVAKLRKPRFAAL